MSTLIPVEVIAEALAKHEYHGRGLCHCGWKSGTEDSFEWIPRHRDHQASVIAALPDIAVVALNPVYFPPSERRIRFEQAAADIRRGHPPVGLYITAAVLEVLDQIAAGGES